MTAQVLQLPIPSGADSFDLVPVPAAHLRRLLDLEAALAYELTYTPAGRSMRPGRVARLRAAYERKT